MPIAQGDRLPDAQFQVVTADGVANTTTADVFGGRKVALFAVPGAFTPTCSERHLPGYVEKAGELKTKGVDAIVCTSVNDAFVMKAWGEEQNVNGAVALLADGGGDFAKALGLQLETGAFGGLRSQRYSMVVEDGVVKVLNIEEPSAYGASSAETLLGQL